MSAAWWGIIILPPSATVTAPAALPALMVKLVAWWGRMIILLPSVTVTVRVK